MTVENICHLKFDGISSDFIGVNANDVTFTPLRKYISNAAYKLINSLFLLCKICSPSNKELWTSLLSVIHPVNCTCIFVLIK